MKYGLTIFFFFDKSLKLRALQGGTEMAWGEEFRKIVGNLKKVR